MLGEYDGEACDSVDLFCTIEHNIILFSNIFSNFTLSKNKKTT